MTIPDEAVQAAVDAYGEEAKKEINYFPVMMRAALTASLPFLQGVKVNGVNPTGLTKALSRLAGNRHSDGVSSIVSADDRSVIINGCYEMMVALKAPSPRAQALEEAAKWHESEADGYEAEIGGTDVTGLMLAKEHRVSAIAIRGLASQPVADTTRPTGDSNHGE